MGAIQLVLAVSRWLLGKGQRLLYHRRILTWPVRWRALRWLDRPLARLLRLKPRMLTSRVSIKRVPFKGTRRERIRYWVWEHHSVRSGLWVAILTGVGLCILSLGVAAIIDVPMLGPQTDIDGIPTTLVATAGYGGALFGFLQAVAIFAVQLRSQQDTSMLPLTPLIARRYFTFFIMASIAGVTIANLIASFAVQLLPELQRAFAALILLNMLAVPALTLAALWYLTTIVAEAGEADMDIALPVLRATMRAQSTADARTVALLNEYVEALKEATIEYSPFAGTSLASATTPRVRVPFRKPGVIHDLDCTRLSRIGELLDGLDDRPKAAIAFANALSENDALLLDWEGTGSADGRVDARTQRKLSSLLNSSFYVKTERDAMIAKDVRQFLTRFETTLKVLAREGRHAELDARLEDFQKLLGAWLDVAPPGETPPERIRLFAIIDRFGGPLEVNLRDVAEAATLSGDTSTVVALADHILRSANACLNCRQPRLMEEFLNTLVFFHYKCLRSDDMADAIGSRLDSGLYYLFIKMRSLHRDTDERDSPIDEAERLSLDAALRFALALIHAAVRFERTRQSLYFVKRVFGHRELSARRADQFHESLVEGGVETTFDYVAVVLVGWSLHILQQDACKDPEAAKSVMGAAVEQLPSKPVLVAQWERLRGSDRPESAIDGRLGIAHWDVRDWDHDYRVGVPEARWGGKDWVRLGLRAALLLSEKQFIGDPSKLFTTAPGRFVWDANKEREALTQLASHECMGIPEGARDAAIDAVMKIIEDRARGSTAQYLRYALKHPLSDKRIAELRKNAIAKYRSSSGWYDALRPAGVGQKATRCPLPRLIETWVPRTYLLDDNNWASGFEEELGKGASTYEAMVLLHLIETTAPRVQELDALARLPDVVRDARRHMTDNGFTPNVLVLPREERFAGALFRKPLWQIEGRGDFEEASLGTWEGLTVLQFPHADPESILLIDTSKTLAVHKSNEPDSGIKIWIEENYDNEEIAETKRIAVAALKSDKSPLPDSHSIQVLARMRALPRLLIADPSASATIGIQSSDGMLALPADSDLYHRPSCDDIELEQDVQYVLRLPSNSKRTPCPKCEPDRWNVE